MSQFLEQAVATLSDTKVEWSTLAIGLCSGAALGALLRLHFIKLSSSFGGDRRSFGNNLIFITLTTLLIIATIKSSLALSLGLVGALSIVRFRTPIKDPQELAYLFLAVAMGVGIGAEAVVTTAAASLFIMLITGLFFRSLAKRQGFSLQGQCQLHVHVPVSLDVADQLEKWLKKVLPSAKIVRWNSDPTSLQIVVLQDGSLSLPFASLVNDFHAHFPKGSLVGTSHQAS